VDDAALFRNPMANTELTHSRLVSSRSSMFADDRKRKINLGGASSASSHAYIVDQARVRRIERLEQKQRQDNARRIQAWWRGLRQARRARKEISRAFDEDVTGITGMRCLILIGRREKHAVAVWSQRMIEGGPGGKLHTSTVSSSHLFRFTICTCKIRPRKLARAHSSSLSDAGTFRGGTSSVSLSSLTDTFI